ncbi:DUF2993 domain-containing protein [Streptomyces sp. NPDC091209]|uniref:LmeA family phospholipid-binding protein n=1 Tax=Streptomyces sp. NPDC091209 TaxID=3365974 RepID=UPI00382205EB
MRALRISLILLVVLGGLFVLADRLAVGFAEDEAAGRIKSAEGLAATPDVSIGGFPFLTQVFGGELDDVKVGIKDYEASTGGTGSSAGTIRIDDLNAEMHGVAFNGGYTSATASRATGSASISYAELLKAAKSEPARVAPGLTAQVVSLSDGGNGKIKVMVSVSVSLGGAERKQTVPVLSSVIVSGDTVKVHADSLPKVGIQLAENRIRSITDFQQTIEQLPGGIKLDKVQAAPDGVEISVKGSDVRLVG